MSASELHAAIADFERRPPAPGSPWARPAPEAEPRRIIRCSPGNVDAAIARALARAVVHGELWTIEVMR
ncbi:MAG TPA: hypothetical protein VKX49_18140 [Bryobacteraceae bacterium]|nr:hypothetical protein [Bryobacteraceae bacterium]